jgi:origin recognition complex subunit 2
MSSANKKRKLSGNGSNKPSPLRQTTSTSRQNGAQDEEDVGPPAAKGASKFVTISSGDAYLTHAAAVTKTSDALLSNYVDPAFTLSSYADALQTYDSTTSNPRLVQHREKLATGVDQFWNQFPRWKDELDQGFNIILNGFGSKIAVVNRFAEEMSRVGNVILVKGYDGDASLPDIIEALERLIKNEENELDSDAEDDFRGNASGRKGKGKEREKDIVPVVIGSVQVSAIENRVRKVCNRMMISGSTSSKRKAIYLIIHNIDGPVLRSAKTISLISLLAAQPRIHLIASVDHIRSALLFPISLATARPSSTPSASDSQCIDSRALNLIYHEVTTLTPYTVEIASSALLSRLFPPSIFPASTSLHDGSSSSSLAQSAQHVLRSVSSRSRKLFNLLAELQLSSLSTLASSVARSILLTSTNQTTPSPLVATLTSVLKQRARDEFIASSDDQVEMLWNEFMDHGVFRKGVIAPVGSGEEVEGGSWVWIALGRDELNEVVEAVEELEKD